MTFKCTTTSAQEALLGDRPDARLKRFTRAVREGERLELESVHQHDSHVRRWIAHLFFLIREDAAEREKG
ncbi:MAG: hypothetical protein M3Z96_13525 [Pseudomonadota bacterium]|nr:hypothetical protein [Pseudomonadota bacterium]